MVRHPIMEYEDAGEGAARQFDRKVDDHRVGCRII